MSSSSSSSSSPPPLSSSSISSNLSPSFLFIFIFHPRPSLPPLVLPSNLANFRNITFSSSSYSLLLLPPPPPSPPPHRLPLADVRTGSSARLTFPATIAALATATTTSTPTPSETATPSPESAGDASIRQTDRTVKGVDQRERVKVNAE